jgi:hypothetical protein
MNGDGVANGKDISPFVAAVLAGSTTTADLCPGDFDGSGLMDLGDVAAFADTLANL